MHQRWAGQRSHGCEQRGTGEHFDAVVLHRLQVIASRVYGACWGVLDFDAPNERALSQD